MAITPLPLPKPFSAPIYAGSADNNVPAVWGTSGQLVGEVVVWGSGVGVYGASGGGAGVYGSSSGSDGVHGESTSNQHAGVSGINNSGTQANNGGPGVYGSSSNKDGVQGWSQSNQNAGVSARNTAGGYGVWAQATGTKPSTGGVAGYFNSDGNDGVQSWSQSSGHAGVSGTNNSGTPGKGGPGVYGSSSNLDGVQGWSQSPQNAGVSARNTAGGYGLWAQAKTAGYFDGNVVVTGDIQLTGGDCAEHFDVADANACEPGTVMVLAENEVLRPCEKKYDRKVAGVISGAGDYKPGLILDQQKSSEGRLPLALVGKVYCKVDASYGLIEVGDLLTTSPTLGHAMKAADPAKAFGAVIGKALRPLHSGQGLIPILFTLQ